MFTKHDLAIIVNREYSNRYFSGCIFFHEATMTFDYGLSIAVDQAGRILEVCHGGDFVSVLSFIIFN